MAVGVASVPDCSARGVHRLVGLASGGRMKQWASAHQHGERVPFPSRQHPERDGKEKRGNLSIGRQFANFIHKNRA